MRIVIADDDRLFQNTIAAILNQYPQQYEMAAQAYDGEEALAKVEQLHPDLLLLDMEMPRISGVEVARQALSLPHSPAILVLSNYDNFDYVRPVLKMGAEDYLLKHEINAQVLVEKLEGIRRHLVQERRLSSQYGKMALFARRNLLRELILNQNGVFPEDLRLFEHQNSGEGTYAVACMQLVNFLILYHGDQNDPQHEKIITTVTDLCTSIFSNIGNGLIAPVQHGEFCILFSFSQESSAEKIRRDTERYLSLIAQNLKKLLSVTAMYAFVCFHGKAARVKRFYQSAREHLDTRPIAQNVDSSIPNLDDEGKLIRLLYQGDAAGVRETLLQIFSNAQEGASSEILGARLMEILRRYLKTEADPADESKMVRQIAEMFRERLSQEETQQRVLNCYETAMELSASGPTGSPASIQTAVAYIRSHYRENLSLSDVANRCGISEVYLSKRFKREMNVSFVSYVNGLRIEAARELLRDSSLSLREISDRTGFRNYNYFIKVFKDITGATPMHFREQLQ